MMAQPQHSAGRPKSRAQVVKPGRLPISEFAFDRAGAASPFGDDLVFPVPVERLTYEHPPATDEVPPHAATPGA